jgi:hypothetical protein
VTNAELRKACADARAQGLEHMILVVTRTREPRGARPRIRLFSGCMGTVVGSQAHDLPGYVKLIVDVAIADVERALDREDA